MNEPPSLNSLSFGHSFDPGPLEEPVRSDHETEVSVGKTHGDPSALLKRGVGHVDGWASLQCPSIALGCVSPSESALVGESLMLGFGER